MLRLGSSRSAMYNLDTDSSLDYPVRRSFSTARTPRTPNGSVDSFEIESQQKFREILEQQRKEMHIFERNYLLENQNIVDDYSNLNKVFDLDERERLQMEGQLVKHQYNMAKAALQRKHKRERQEFWDERNRQKNDIIPITEEVAMTPSIQRPRSINISHYPTPKKTASSAPNMLDIEKDEVVFGNDEPMELKSDKKEIPVPRERGQIKPITGTFLSSRYVNMSKTNKLGRFGNRPKSGLPQIPYSSSLRSPTTARANRDFNANSVNLS